MSTGLHIRSRGATGRGFGIGVSLRAGSGSVLCLVVGLALSFGPAVAAPREHGPHGPARDREERVAPRYAPRDAPRDAYVPPEVRRGGEDRRDRFADPPPPVYRSEGPRRDSLGADWRPRPDEARRGVREGRLTPLGQVIDQIRRHAPGRQLDAGLETDIYGRSVYRVRWAGADGRRSDYIVDAETGRILGVDGR